MKILFFLSFLTAAAFAAAPPAGDALDLIRSKDRELQALLRASPKDPTGQRRERIKELINGIFDFEELGKRALPSFGTLPKEKRDRFVKAFRTMIENSSLKKLEVYRTDSTRYEQPVNTADGIDVKAHALYDGQESVLSYRMTAKTGSWRAWDLVIDDLSTCRNYKEQFRSILKNKTIDDLIKILEKKANEESKAAPAPAVAGAEKSSSATTAPAKTPVKTPAQKTASPAQKVPAKAPVPAR